MSIKIRVFVLRLLLPRRNAATAAAAAVAVGSLQQQA